jgi:hypothetical protein
LAPQFCQPVLVFDDEGPAVAVSPADDVINGWIINLQFEEDALHLCQGGFDLQLGMPDYSS